MTVPTLPILSPYFAPVRDTFIRLISNGRKWSLSGPTSTCTLPALPLDRPEWRMLTVYATPACVSMVWPMVRLPCTSAHTLPSFSR